MQLKFKMKQFLKIVVYDYKGGELRTNVSNNMDDLIDYDSLEELETNLNTNYAYTDEGEYPTEFYTIKDNKFISLDYNDIINELSEDHYLTQKDDE